MVRSLVWEDSACHRVPQLPQAVRPEPVLCSEKPPPWDACAAERRAAPTPQPEEARMHQKINQLKKKKKGKQRMNKGNKQEKNNLINKWNISFHQKVPESTKTAVCSSQYQKYFIKYVFITSCTSTQWQPTSPEGQSVLHVKSGKVTRNSETDSVLLQSRERTKCLN